MSYSWLITVDHFDGETTDSAAGTYGPRVSKLKAQDIREHPDAVEFRMFDDDKNLMCDGLYVGPDDETMFAPLDDFGTPNWGCTYIEYKNAAGDWEIL